MKSILKISLVVLGVLGLLIVITLLAWVSWQVMPVNPYHDQWKWNFPPFPLAIAVWLVGTVPTVLLAFISFIIGAIVGAVFERPQRKPTTED